MVFLAKGGQAVYVGAARKALEFFTDLGFSIPHLVNPADFFMDVIAGKYARQGDPDFTPQTLVQLWNEAEVDQQHSNTSLVPPSTRALVAVKPAGFLRSLLVFSYRASLQCIRPMYVHRKSVSVSQSSA